MKKSIKIAWIVIPIISMTLFTIFVYHLLRGISWYQYSDYEVDYEYTIEFRIDWLHFKDYPSMTIEIVNKYFSSKLAYIENVNNITKSWIKYPDTLKVYCGYKVNQGEHSKLISDTLSIYLFEKHQLFEYDTSQRTFLKHEYIWQFKKR